MELKKYIHTLTIITLIFIAGCADKNIHSKTVPVNNYITVTGVARETKDGFYVAGFVLVHEEIQKYTHGSSTEKYRDRKIEVTGKVKEVNPECTPYVQCRKGPYRIIYDLKSVKIIE